ncbi:phage gp6-like head-tail connector protein [Providencia alcalifaciens]|uniref:Phage gp6-like head-tail connector protein n=1 Tax=Providencia alcalifaciens TaxID=126385 RepID=A0AAW9V892_9GAMM|nr:phage gp6-like head-tail connector protein [Providencia alcalifaciens]MTC34015.1 phage gp6-like head-tail connector protein [Providencia alcalifaciens]MTC34020.1 phage gp6-like head-tail connector protein [Providencia alcalifaciens]
MLSLEVVKSHCNIDPEFTDDDKILTIYIGSSVKYVENYTRRTLYENESSEGYQNDPESLLLSDDVKNAMLLLIGQWYENREATNIGNITSALPFATEALLQPYRIYGL